MPNIEHDDSSGNVYLIKDAVVIVLIISVWFFITATAMTVPTTNNFFSSLLATTLMIVVDNSLIFCLFLLLKHTRSMLFVWRWIIIAIGVPAVSMIQSAWDTIVLVVLTNRKTVALDTFFTAAFANMVIAGLFVALFEIMASNRKLKNKNRALLDARVAEKHAHMIALRLQLNPHFLFNALNTISGLIENSEYKSASTMTDRLAFFMRESLIIDPSHLRSLEDEFEMLDSFLNVHGMLLGDKLIYEFDLPEDLRCALIPAFILQPLLENCIKYGAMPSAKPVWVHLVTRRVADDLLCVKISNTGASTATPPKQGAGVGLNNTKERMALIYGERATVRSERSSDEFVVELTFPLQFNDGGSTRHSPLEDRLSEMPV